MHSLYITCASVGGKENDYPLVKLRRLFRMLLSALMYLP